MPYAKQMLGSWSLTEGRGLQLHNHILNKQYKAWARQQGGTNIELGAVPIPSAHHTYGSVSNLVNEIPEKARKSIGPQWVLSDAPVTGQLIMEFCAIE